MTNRAESVIDEFDALTDGKDIVNAKIRSDTSSQRKIDNMNTVNPVEFEMANITGDVVTDRIGLIPQAVDIDDLEGKHA